MTVMPLAVENCSQVVGSKYGRVVHKNWEFLLVDYADISSLNRTGSSAL